MLLSFKMTKACGSCPKSVFTGTTIAFKSSANMDKTIFIYEPQISSVNPHITIIVLFYNMLCFRFIIYISPHHRRGTDTQFPFFTNFHFFFCFDIECSDDIFYKWDTQYILLCFYCASADAAGASFPAFSPAAGFNAPIPIDSACIGQAFTHSRHRMHSLLFGVV